MRIHTDFLEESDLRKVATLAGVSFTRLNTHGSRKRAQAFDIILTGSSPRRQNGGPDQAATWDEWGFFLATLFDIDRGMTIPRAYETAERFHWATGERFKNFDLADQHRTGHRWVYAGIPRSFECECGATSRH